GRGDVAPGVDHEQQGEVRGGDVALDDGAAGARRGEPVDVADVVPGRVLVQVVEVLAVALVDRAVPSLEQPGRATHDGQLQARPDEAEPGRGAHRFRAPGPRRRRSR